MKKDCVTVYDLEKKKLKIMLKNVSKFSVKTDMLKSTNQKIEYMVITAHLVDYSWRLQKLVINFVHLPPPLRETDIVDNI